MDRAGPQLPLGRRSGLEPLATVDPGRERVVVYQDAVQSQHVRQEVVGEHRERVDVGEVGRAGQDEVVDGDPRALLEAGVVEEPQVGLVACSWAKRAADPSAKATNSSVSRPPAHAPSWRRPSA
jgi:hypothetical protein